MHRTVGRKEMERKQRGKMPQPHNFIYESLIQIDKNNNPDHSATNKDSIIQWISQIKKSKTLQIKE